MAGVVAAIAITVAFAEMTTARAATVRASSGGESARDQVIFTAADGERNQVLISPTADPDSFDYEFVVRDAGAVITPGIGCEAIDQHTVGCRGQLLPYRVGLGEVVASLGDGDDELRVSELPPSDRLPPTVIVNGGAGNDELVGSTGGGLLGRLDGGPGDDQLWGADTGDDLRGGGGRDQLHGLGGDDRLSDGDRDDRAGEDGPGQDLLDGGAGNDTVSYAQRTASVAVNIGDDRPDGGRGEGDRLTGIESIIGGSGDDRLIGDRRPNVIHGGGGHDRVIGRGGDDALAADAGTVDCGRGKDSVGRSSFVGYPPVYHTFTAVITPPNFTRNCEAIVDDRFEHRLPVYPAVVRPRFVRYRVWRPAESEDRDPVLSFGSVVLEDGRLRRLGRGRFNTGQSLVSVVLTPLGRRLASRRQGVRATVMLTHNILPGQDEGHLDGYAIDLEWIIRLKVPR